MKLKIKKLITLVLWLFHNFHNVFYKNLKEFYFKSQKINLTYKLNPLLTLNGNFNLNEFNTVIQLIKKIDQQNKLTFFLSLSKTQKMLGVQKVFFSLKKNKGEKINSSLEYPGSFSLRNNFYLMFRKYLGSKQFWIKLVGRPLYGVLRVIVNKNLLNWNLRRLTDRPATIFFIPHTSYYTFQIFSPLAIQLVKIFDF